MNRACLFLMPNNHACASHEDAGLSLDEGQRHSLARRGSVSLRNYSNNSASHLKLIGMGERNGTFFSTGIIFFS
ncbi:hypothetical protein [Paenibacillus dendritiformis]|uniref:hypothetical protein n=1 Tax=Paenibacillus dendritiformis TaxID=130049 RepID=UPI0018CD66D4|nr:hypothetical protein [Paenibacillus dendritiformis]